MKHAMQGGMNMIMQYVMNHIISYTCYVMYHEPKHAYDMQMTQNITLKCN